MSRAAARPRVAVVGAGRLARALLPLLRAAGYPIVAVVAPRAAAARSAARSIRGARAGTDPVEAARRATLLLLAVPDGRIAALAGQLARDDDTDWRRRTVLHHAGALGLEPLEPLARVGAAVGLLHPLQCLGDPTLAPRVLPGSRARVEGDRRGRVVARRLARDLGLLPLRRSGGWNESDRATYHAAASVVSNDLLALLALGIDLLESIGIGRRTAREALGALARGTLIQAERSGVRAALTGPVARGDVETLSAQLDSLARHSPDAAALHRLLSARLHAMAVDGGRPLPHHTRVRLRKLLAGRRSRRGL